MMKEGWVYKKLGSVTKVVSGSTPKTNIKEYWGGSNKWVTPAELNDRMFILDTKRTITDKAVLHTNLNLLPVGTVLLSSRAPIGKVAIVGTPMYCNQGFKNLICSDLLYNLFLYWFLKGKKNYLNSLGRGATFKEISKNIVESILIPLPELSEQKKVVNELEKLNEILTKKYEQLKELDRLGQSIFYDMFGDPVNNEKKWEIKKLKDLCIKITDGEHFRPQTVELGIPFLSAKDITNGYVSFENPLYISKQTAEKALKRCDPKYGDILIISRGATIGRSCIVDTDKVFCLLGSVILLKLNNDVINHYLLNLIRSQSVQQQLFSLCGAAAQQAIYLKNLKEFSVPMPPLDIQYEFSEKIKIIEQKKLKIKKSIGVVQQLLDYTMNKYFG